MAHLIKVNGYELPIKPPQEDGFSCDDIAALLGPKLRILCISRYMALFVVDLPEQETTGKNAKATHIVQQVLDDAGYAVYGDALFISREELTPFLREAGIPDEDEEPISTPRRCRSTVLRRGHVLRWKVTA